MLQSLYTGVYARGGPSNIEPSNELSALLDRSPADVRGVKFNGSPGISVGNLDHVKTCWLCMAGAFWYLVLVVLLPQQILHQLKYGLVLLSNCSKMAYVMYCDLHFL